MTVLKTAMRGEFEGNTSEWGFDDYSYASVDMSGGDKGYWMCYTHNDTASESKIPVKCPHAGGAVWDSEVYIGALAMEADLATKLRKKVKEYTQDVRDYHKEYTSTSADLDLDAAATAVKCISTPTEEEYSAAFADLQRHHDVLIAAAQGVKNVAERTTTITKLLLDADGSGNLDFPEPYTVVDPADPTNILTNQTESEYIGNTTLGNDTGYTGEVMLKSPVQKGNGTIGLYPMRFPPEEWFYYAGIDSEDFIREGIAYRGRWGSAGEAQYNFEGSLNEVLQAKAVDLLGGSEDTLSIAHELSGYQPKEFRPIFYDDSAQSLIGSKGELAFLYPDFPLEMVAANAPRGYLVQNTAQEGIATQMMLGRDAAVEYRNMIGYALDATPSAKTAHDSLLAPLNQYINAMQAWIDTVKVIDCWHRMVKWDLSDQAKKADAWRDLRNKYGLDVDDALITARIAALTLEAATVNLSEIGTEHVPPFFREQCFLLTEMPWFSTYKKRELEANLELKRLPYIANTENNPDGEFNACLQMDGEPFGFMNRLTQYPGYANIASMKTSEIANLQPLIRLFKILVDKDGKESQLEIPFDSYFTKNDLELFRNKASRGVGVGIQDFTFSYEADNPFAVKKSIKAKLTMFANNFTELLRARYVDVNGSAEEFKYVDLALKTGVAKSFSVGSLNPNEADVVIANLDKLRFRLKAVIGWNYRDAWGTPASDEYELNTLSPKVRTALYDSFVTLSLTPTVHEFDIDDQGRVKFSINYLAYVEDFYDQPAFNIFPDVFVGDGAGLAKYSVRHPMEHYTEQARVYRDLKTQLFAAKCKPDEMSIMKEEMATDIEVYRQESLAGIIDLLIKEEKIRYITLKDESVYKFRRYGPRWSGMDEATSGDEAWAEVNVYNPAAGGVSSAAISKEVEDQLKLAFPTRHR